MSKNICNNSDFPSIPYALVGVGLGSHKLVGVWYALASRAFPNGEWSPHVLRVKHILVRASDSV